MLLSLMSLVGITVHWVSAAQAGQSPGWPALQPGWPVLHTVTVVAPPTKHKSLCCRGEWERRQQLPQLPKWQAVSRLG